MVADQGDLGVGHALRANGSQPGEADGPVRGRVPPLSSAAVDRCVQRALWQDRGRWVSPRRNATIADLQRGKNAGELRPETEPELLNDAIFGALYYRLLLRSGPLTRRMGEELVEQVIRGHRSGNAGS